MTACAVPVVLPQRLTGQVGGWAQGLEGLLQETGERSGRSSPAPLSRGALDAGRLARAATESAMQPPDIGGKQRPGSAAAGGPDRSYSTGDDRHGSYHSGFTSGYGGYGRAARHTDDSGGGGYWQSSEQSSPRDSLASYPDTPSRSAAGGERRPLRHATSESLGAGSGRSTLRHGTSGKLAPWEAPQEDRF